MSFVNPYTLLVAVVLSAQSTDVGVNKATRPLFAKVDTPQKMLAFGETRLVEAIRSLGFFNMKAKNVIALSRLLVEEHGGEVPREREALQRLPGVGRKTASVVLNTAFGVPAIAVDTHIFRVSNRTGLAPGDDPDEVADLLERVVPERFKLHAHHWLILHGRYVCVARKPKCPVCIIADICRYKDKTQPAGAFADYGPRGGVCGAPALSVDREPRCYSDELAMVKSRRRLCDTVQHRRTLERAA